MTTRRTRIARRTAILVAVSSWAAVIVGTIFGLQLALLGLLCAAAGTATLTWFTLHLFPSALAAWRLGYRAGIEDSVDQRMRGDQLV